MAGFIWEIAPETVWPAMTTNYVLAIQRGLYAIAQRWTPEIENYMKANAPWTDRTGNARAGLWSDTNHVIGVMVEIIFAHGMDYGLWLEILHAGAYAIIQPSLDYFAPRIWADVRRMLS